MVTLFEFSKRECLFCSLNILAEWIIEKFARFSIYKYLIRFIKKAFFLSWLKFMRAKEQIPLPNSYLPGVFAEQRKNRMRSRTSATCRSSMITSLTVLRLQFQEWTVILNLKIFFLDFKLFFFLEKLLLLFLFQRKSNVLPNRNILMPWKLLNISEKVVRDLTFGAL